MTKDEKKEAIRALIADGELVVSDHVSAQIWWGDPDITETERGCWIVSDAGEGEQFEHNHKTFDAAFKEFSRRTSLGK